MRELYSMAASIGSSEPPTLILGETGVGKEVLARHLHALSPRASKPFLKLNCAALPGVALAKSLHSVGSAACARWVTGVAVFVVPNASIRVTVSPAVTTAVTMMVRMW